MRHFAVAALVLVGASLALASLGDLSSLSGGSEAWSEGLTALQARGESARAAFDRWTSDATTGSLGPDLGPMALWLGALLAPALLALNWTLGRSAH